MVLVFLAVVVELEPISLVVIVELEGSSKESKALGKELESLTIVKFKDSNSLSLIVLNIVLGVKKSSLSNLVSNISN